MSLGLHDTQSFIDTAYLTQTDTGCRLTQLDSGFKHKNEKIIPLDGVINFPITTKEWDILLAIQRSPRSDGR